MVNKIYYKVVKDNLTSMTVDEPQYTISYKLGEWVEPQIKGSFIFIFKSLSDVRICILANGWRNYKIYECEAKVVKTRKPIFIRSIRSMWTFPLFVKLAALRLRHQKYTHLLNKSDQPPSGTLFASSIKLIREVLK